MDTGLTNSEAAILGKRIAAVRGRIDKQLGPASPISPAIQKLIRSNHNDILGSRYLKQELIGFTRVLKALAAEPGVPEFSELLAKLNDDPLKPKNASMLCPIWRHRHQTEMALAAFIRYLFDAVWDQAFFVTVIIDYAPNLAVLEERLDEYKARLKSVERRMTQDGRGLMMFGTLEPDLKSFHQITRGHDLAVATKQLDWDVLDHGGWVTSAHLIGRAVQSDELSTVLEEEFPSSGWRRVRWDNLKRKKTRLENVLATAAYLLKVPEWLGKPGITRGEGKAEHDKMMRELQSAFMGSTLHQKGFSAQFDGDAAIRQWATFVDRMGPRKLCYSVENVHAQKWLSASETQLFIQRGEMHWMHGHTAVEVHRDREPGVTRLPKRQNGKAAGHNIRRRTRALRYDPDWDKATDFTDLSDPTVPIAFLR